MRTFCFMRQGLCLVLSGHFGRQTESMKACWSVNISASWLFKRLIWFLLWCCHQTRFLSSLSSQELSEFSEGPDTIWTEAGGEFDQVRWTSSKGATDLVILFFYSKFICLLFSSVNRGLWGWMAADCEKEENFGRCPRWAALRFLCCGVQTAVVNNNNNLILDTWYTDDPFIFLFLFRLLTVQFIYGALIIHSSLSSF